MDSARFRRQAVALIAAYAMAVHALLSALGPIAPATSSGPLAVLCSHDADGSGLPDQHDLPCAAICAATGHGIAGTAPPDLTVAIIRPPVVIALVPQSEWAPPRLAFRGPQAPRGPPLA